MNKEDFLAMVSADLREGVVNTLFGRDIADMDADELKATALWLAQKQEESNPFGSHRLKRHEAPTWTLTLSSPRGAEAKLLVSDSEVNLSRLDKGELLTKQFTKLVDPVLELDRSVECGKVGT